MTRPRLAGVALASLLLAGVAAGCSSSDPDADAPASSMPKAEATSSSTTGDAADDGADGADGAVEVGDDGEGTDGLRGVKYCEVLLLTQDDDGFTAAVWNTMGMSDCPEEQWAALDAASIAEDRGAVAAILNGPRYWALDSITTDLRQGAPETSFGEVAMFQAATLALGDELPSQAPYTERGVARDTVFGFEAGSEVYELVAPDATTYVMQSWSQIVDPQLAEDDLPGLGERLELPAGWEFRTRVLEADLDVESDEGVATVVQDELQNTYQRIHADA